VGAMFEKGGGEWENLPPPMGGGGGLHYIAPIWLRVQDVDAQWACTPNTGHVYTYTTIHAQYIEITVN